MHDKQPNLLSNTRLAKMHPSSDFCLTSPYHGCGCPTRCGLRGPLVFVLGYDDRDNNVARRHPYRANREDGFATQPVNVQHCRDGGDEHDNADHACRKKTSLGAAESKVTEDGGRIVQNRLSRLAPAHPSFH